MRLTGRVDMRAVEQTVHYLLARGFEARAFPDLYAGLVYTAFQERATYISHNNVGKLAAAEAIVEIQKKVSALLTLTQPSDDSDRRQS